MGFAKRSTQPPSHFTPGQSSPNAATPPEVEDIGVPLYARQRSTGGARLYGLDAGRSVENRTLHRNEHRITMNGRSV